MKRVIRDGNVAVLVSRGYGAGWSTWCTSDDIKEKLMFDPVLVQMLEDDMSIEDMTYYVNVAYPDQYVGGLKDLGIHWVPQGERFRIDEYDGAESIVLESEEKWVTA
jgi:hypothetical protein